MDKLYTWQGVSNELLKDRLVSQRKERMEAEQDRDRAINEVEDVYASVDEELKVLQRQVEELTRSNEIQAYEIQSLREKISQIDVVPIIIQGEEQDMYPGEIKDIILSVVEDTLPQVKEGSRREDVLKDILEANNYERLSDARKSGVKRLFKGYTNMSATICREML